MYDKNMIKNAVDVELIENSECSKLLSDFFKKKRKK